MFKNKKTPIDKNRIFDNIKEYLNIDGFRINITYEMYMGYKVELIKLYEHEFRLDKKPPFFAKWVFTYEVKDRYTDAIPKLDFKNIMNQVKMTFDDMESFKDYLHSIDLELIKEDLNTRLIQYNEESLNKCIEYAARLQKDYDKVNYIFENSNPKILSFEGKWHLVSFIEEELNNNRIVYYDILNQHMVYKSLSKEYVYTIKDNLTVEDVYKQLNLPLDIKYMVEHNQIILEGLNK